MAHYNSVMKKLPYDLGMRIQKLREKRAMSQEALASKCGLSQSHVCHFESGTRLPSLPNFFAIAKALRASLGDFS